MISTWMEAMRVIIQGGSVVVTYLFDFSKPSDSMYVATIGQF